MTSGTKRTKTIFFSCLLLFMISLFLTLFVVVTHFSEKNRKIEEVKKNAQAEAEKAADEIVKKTERFEKIASELCGKLDRTTPNDNSKKEFIEHIKKLNYREPELYEIGYAFEPYYYGGKYKSFGLKISKDDKKPDRIDDSVNYLEDEDNEEILWYHEARGRKDGGVWTKLFFHPKAKRSMATYSKPFYKTYSEDSKRDEKKVAGVVFVRFSVGELEQGLRNLNLGENGYAFLLSKEGLFISHPTLDYYNKADSIVGLANKPKYSQFFPLCENAIKDDKNSNKIEGYFQDPITNQSSLIVFKTIPSTQWLLGVVVMRNDFIPLEFSRRNITSICILTALSLIFLIALFLKVYRGGGREIWILSSCVSLFCIVLIIITLYSHWQYQGSQIEDANWINNQHSLKKLQQEITTRILKEKEKLPGYIHTGFYVQSITFPRETEVRLSGFIWQRYDRTPYNVEKGFILMGSETKELIEVFRDTKEKPKLIRWKFTVALSKKFDYTNYPFLSEKIPIQLQQAGFQEDIIPVPDFDAYALPNPAAKSWLSDKIGLSGWKVEKMFFSWVTSASLTNFGLVDDPRDTQLPGLNFNILIKKEFIGTALSLMFPIFLVIVLLFIILMITPRVVGKSGSSGFRGMNIVLVCVVFFLIAFLSHANLRDTLMSNGIIYLEYFYFITYFLVFLVIINALLFNRGKREIPFVQYRENYIPRVLYWPICTFLMLLVTLMFFY